VKLNHIPIDDEFFVEEVKFKTEKWFINRKDELQGMTYLKFKEKIKEIKGVLLATEEERSQMADWQNQCKRIAVEMAFKII
jgi:hypothetical protein